MDDCPDCTEFRDGSLEALNLRLGEELIFEERESLGRRPSCWYPFSIPSSSIVVKPLLALVTVLTLVVRSGRPFASRSRPCRWRSRCCFRFRPCNRFIMMSLIRGKYRSRLSALASWLNVASRILRKRSGTLPKSDVSTFIAVKARHAILNS